MYDTALIVPATCDRPTIVCASLPMVVIAGVNAVKVRSGGQGLLTALPPGGRGKISTYECSRAVQPAGSVAEH
jgi:hypothetical protein